MFEHCYFITGSDRTIIIVVPEKLPDASILNLSFTTEEISFAADYEVFAKVAYSDQDVYQRLLEHTQVGMIAFEEKDNQPLPHEITHMAQIEVQGIVS